MEDNKDKNIYVNNIQEKLVSLGLLIPTTIRELEIFEISFENFPFKYIEKEMSLEEVFAILTTTIIVDAEEENDKISLDNFDKWFHSLEYLPPRNAEEWKQFRELYKDYPFTPPKLEITAEEILEKLV